MQTVIIDNTKEWTVEDYLSLEQTNKPCELINGELIMSPAPSPQHQRISIKLFKILDATSKGLGEVFYAPIDLYIDDKNVFQPDLVFISEINKKFITERGLEGPPDLIIEIISPSNSYTDRNQRKKNYLAFGVKEYWIVDPGNKTLEIYNYASGETPVLYLAEEGIVASIVLPELSFSLAELFTP